MGIEFTLATWMWWIFKEAPLCRASLLRLKGERSLNRGFVAFKLFSDSAPASICPAPVAVKQEPRNAKSGI